MDHFKRASQALERAEAADDLTERDGQLRIADAWVRLGGHPVGIGRIKPEDINV